VELLPRAPSSHYRIRVKLRLDYPNLTDFVEWGVYLKHASFTTEKGLQDLFHAVWFAGDEELKQPALAPKQVTATLQLRLYSDLVEPRDEPFRLMYIGSQGKPYRYAIPYTPNPNDRWQTIAVDVRPTATTAHCQLGPGEKADLGPLTSAECERQLGSALRVTPDLKTVRPDQLQGHALGIYVRTGACTVQQFVIQADKDN
jgi:hypothetical protein